MPHTSIVNTPTRYLSACPSPVTSSGDRARDFAFPQPTACARVASRRTVDIMMDERNKPPTGPAPSPTPDLTPQAAPSALLRWVPGLAVFRDYRREWLHADLLAGVSVCVVMIPSVIAYAGLMGLPPQHGLYAALVPLLVYPFFGSSRQVIVGPDIAISLLIASAIAPLAGGNPTHAATLAATVAVLSGLLLLLGARQNRRDCRLPLQARAGRLHDRRGLDPDGLAARQTIWHPARAQRLLPPVGRTRRQAAPGTRADLALRIRAPGGNRCLAPSRPRYPTRAGRRGRGYRCLTGTAPGRPRRGRSRRVSPRAARLRTARRRLAGHSHPPAGGHRHCLADLHRGHPAGARVRREERLRGQPQPGTDRARPR